MNDAAKNVEIEDVLASIRRLVSDEVDASLSEKVTADLENSVEDQIVEEHVSASAAPVEALVLTPSLRVAGDQDVQEAASASDVENDTTLVLNDVLETAPLSDDVAEDSATPQAQLLRAVAEQVAEINEDSTEDDTYELAMDAELEPSDEALRASVEAVVDRAAEPVVADAADDVHASAEAPEESPRPAALEAKIARLETLINAQDETWEAEGADAPQTLEWEDVPEEDAPVFHAEPDNDEIDPNPEATSEDEFVSRPEEETLNSSGEGDHADAVSEQIDEDIDILAGSDETLLDEEMLRDMVAAIVREELQGALGERITRNVRKLVRREIHRALASHELD